MLVICVGLLSVSPAAATSARVLALGGDGAYLEDATGVLRWYGSLGDYPDLATLELADLTDDGDAPGNFHGLPGHGGGAHFRLDDAGSWGTAAFYVEDDLPGDMPGGAFTALWSRRCGPVEAGIGARMTTFGEGLVASAAGDRGESRYDHDYGLGLRYHRGRRLTVDLAGEVINHRTESVDAVHHLLPRDDWSSFGARVRAFLGLSTTVTIVPLVDHLTDRTATYAPAIGGPADLDAALTSYGLALHLQRDDANLVLLSAEYRCGHEDHDLLVDETIDADWTVSRRSFSQIRGRLGVESRVLPWLRVRAAMQYVRYDEEIRRHGYFSGHEDLDHEGVVTPVSVGLGVQWRSFTVDVLYNDSAPVNPGLLGGGLQANGRDGFTALSVGYAFP
jgi:hypothetical protein